MISYRERFDILPSRFSFRSKSNYQTQPANQITKKLNQISVVNTNLTVNDREHFATFTTHLPLIYHIFEQPNFIINSHYPTENITHLNFHFRSLGLGISTSGFTNSVKSFLVVFTWLNIFERIYFIVGTRTVKEREENKASQDLYSCRYYWWDLIEVL